MVGPNIGGARALALLASLPALALAACGGRSQSHQLESATSAAGGTSGATAANAGGSSSGSGGGPSYGTLLIACLGVCDTGTKAGCQTAESACPESCAEASLTLSTTAECANAELAYVGCVQSLSDVCDVLDGPDLETVCDYTEGVVRDCLKQICRAHPDVGQCGTY